jgi:cysteine desulfurase / selenocysteine lyase
MNSTIGQIRQEFPQLSTTAHSHPLIYLDNAATTPKPQCVIDSQVDFYTNWNSNIHRSSSWLSGKATNLYENTRQKVADYLHALSPKEIVFTSGCTESINLVATSLNIFTEGGVILVSDLEHHSNLLPWQRIAQQKNLILRSIPVLASGELDLSGIDQLFEGVQLLAITHVSNVTGGIVLITKLAEIAHKHHALVLVDGAQAVGHLSVNVQELDCDFYCFSAHKMYGPTGVGVLYTKESCYGYLDLYKLGGGMVQSVSTDSFITESYPTCFEAGTPNIAGVVGFGVAIDWLYPLLQNSVIQQNTDNLITTALQSHLPLLNTNQVVPIFSFTIPEVNSFDLAQYLDLQGICVRSGTHCATPLVTKLNNAQGVLRMSCGVYSTVEELEFAIRKIERYIEIIT